MKRLTHATAFVVFGATGDLTQNKLYPALYQLAKRNLLPKVFRLYGVARESMSAAAFKADIAKDLKRHFGKDLEVKSLNKLLKYVHYIPADLTDPEAYQTIENQIKADETKLGHGIQRIFYLALPPSLFGKVVKNVETCKAGKQLCTVEHVWSRVIIEKPFGYDLKTAQKLDRVVKATFDDRQVYRLDHYLGKESLQNIFAFRFANPFFEEMWNRDHVAEIQIHALETLGLEGRFSYYDGAGALRDMIQNHLMQFMAYLTMSQPLDLTAESLHKEKEAVLSKVRAFDTSTPMVLGQYAGYRKESGIPSTSKTETYAAVKLQIDTPRWRGVPIYIRTGKNLMMKDTSASIVFRHQSRLFKTDSGAETNVIKIQLSPSPAMTLKVNIQKPGLVMETDTAGMHYCRGEQYQEPPIGDYERLLFNVLEGDQSLFTSSKEVLSSWKAIDPFLKKASRTKPKSYKSGSLGPKEADQLLSKEKSHWYQVPTGCPIHK